MIFEITILISFILNAWFIIKIFKNWLNIEDKTFNELQNYLSVSKPDKLFKRYYDAIFNNVERVKHINNQVITIEFNENYVSYHAGKACMSDIINNLNYTFKNLMIAENQPKLILKNKTWFLVVGSKKIDLSRVKFENVAVNFHINYIDLKHIAKTVKRSDLDLLTKTFKELITMEHSIYVFYDIYTNQFKEVPINIKTFSDYINTALFTHYSNICKNSDVSINDVITKFNKISKKYDYLFDVSECSLLLYNPKTNEIALPNPDGLIINGQKIV